MDPVLTLFGLAATTLNDAGANLDGLGVTAAYIIDWHGKKAIEILQTRPNEFTKTARVAASGVGEVPHPCCRSHGAGHFFTTHHV
jgi:hypothetical protein